MARSRAYRWGEDGLLGWCDRQCRLCFRVALWNGRDPILKERLFGLTGPEGNHGEDVKELYYYLDATPTHSYCRALYKYPQAAFPYERAGPGQCRARLSRARVRDHGHRGVRRESLLRRGGGVRQGGARTTSWSASPSMNRGPDPASLCVLPTLWFRNTWIWGCEHEGCTLKPRLRGGRARAWWPRGTPRCRPISASSARPRGGERAGAAVHRKRDQRAGCGARENYTPYVKDAFHRYVVDGEHGRRESGRARDPGRRQCTGSALAPGEPPTVRLRLHDGASAAGPGRSATGFDAHRSTQRREEADAFYAAILPAPGAARRRPGPAPGLRRAAVDQAVLPLLRARLAARAIPASSTAPGAVGRAATRTGSTPVQPRRDLHARQLGVSLVRRLGPGLPHDPVRATSTRTSPGSSWCCCCASGTCTPTGRSRPTNSPSATSIRRCTPGPAGGSTRPAAARASRTAASSPRTFHKLLHQLHLVGQPQGPRGPQPVRRRVPWPGQHRGLRPLRSRCPPARHLEQADATAWMAILLPDHAGHRAGAGACTTPPTRTWPPSSSSTSWPSPTP